jgi:hypothetical protein
MIAFYVDGSIYAIPGLVDIARLLQAVIFTDSTESRDVLRSHYPEIRCKCCGTIAEVRDRLNASSPEAVVYADYQRDTLALSCPTWHIQVFHGTSDKRYGVIGKVRDYDFLLLPGERGRQRRQAAGLLTPDNHAVVGYPKLDRVFRGELCQKSALAALAVDAARPTVLYAPTWSDSRQNSSLRKYADTVLSAAPAAYNLVVKLHPNTRRYHRRRHDQLERLAREHPDHIRFLGNAPDIVPIMAAADLLLCDVSSVSHEFLAFNRPFVFLDPRIVRLGREKTWIWRCGTVVTSPGEVWPAVRAALADPERFAAERRAALEQVFHLPDGRAAERSAQAIRDFLARNGPARN